jgi:hypothetical protein
MKIDLTKLPERVLLQLLDEKVEDSIKQEVLGLVPRASLNPRELFEKIAARCNLDIPSSQPTNRVEAYSQKSGCFMDLLEHPIPTHVSMRKHWFEFGFSMYRLHWLPWGRVFVPDPAELVLGGTASGPYYVRDAHGSFWEAINDVTQGLFLEDFERSMSFEVVWNTPAAEAILDHLREIDGLNP